MDDMGSYHLPILTTLDLRQQKRSRAQRKTFWNFKKANWKAYREKTDIELENIDQNQPIEQFYYIYAPQYMQQQRKLLHKVTVKNSRPSGHLKKVML